MPTQKTPICRSCQKPMYAVPEQFVQVCSACGQQHMAETWEPIKPDYEEDVLAELSATRKINGAIQIVRDRSTLTLKPARDYVLGLAKRNNLAVKAGGCALVALGVTAAVLALVASLAGAAFAADDDEKRAAAEKEGDAFKMEVAEDIARMQDFEMITPTLAVAVKNCRAVKPPAPAEGKKESPVKIEGNGWGALAGALLGAADRGTAPSRDEGGDGRILLHVDMIVSNDGEDILLITPEDFTLSTPDKFTVPYSVRTFNADRPLAGLYLPAGMTTGGTVVFAVEPYPEYILNYYNPRTHEDGTKRLIVMMDD